jgi:hypothetical protein
MKISEDGTSRWLTDQTLWLDETNLMLVRSCWKELLATVLNKKHVILRGKAGRGKSLFILFVVFEILYCAKLGKTCALFPNAEPFPAAADLRIVYISRDGVKHLVTVNKVCTEIGWPTDINYCFSDNVDISDASVGSLLTMAVTSGDLTVLKEFNKRVQACKPDTKAILYMPSLILEEMALLFPLYTPGALQFKFDIVGGNPRMFEVSEKAKSSSQFYAVVKSALQWMFGEEYLPTETSETELNQLGKWAIDIVVTFLELALQEAQSSAPRMDSSFFREYFIEENYSVASEQYASVFLGLVADKLQAAFDASIIGNLTRLFGSAGLGNAFEFMAHAILFNTDKQHWCKSSTGEYKQLILGNRRKVLIRNVEDIKSLKEDDYGLPTICNFPIIDAVLPPDMGLQMTISDTHEGSNLGLSAILSVLKIPATDFTLVFVVPEDVLSRFSFPRNLDGVKMYVTIPNVVSKEAFKRLSLKRKSEARKLRRIPNV